MAEKSLLALKFLLVLLGIYPLALMTQIGFDLMLGDSLFASELLYHSKRILLGVILNDWIMSTAVIFPTLVIAILILRVIPRGIALAMAILIFMLGLVLPHIVNDIPSLLGFSIAFTFMLSALTLNGDAR
jgi:hypothetical protein